MPRRFSQRPLSAIAALSKSRPRRSKNWRNLADKHADELSGYQTPVQVCPRGCEHHEPARRDVLTRTRFGRVKMHVEFDFETSNCPLCGARLVRHCARCGHEIFAPIANRCRFCGLPPPWAVERRADSDRSSVQHWRREKGVNAPATRLYNNPRQGGIWVIEGDITRIDVDAIISNDDIDGQMWSQVSRAIKSAAGSDVERMAREERPYKLGQAWWTKAGTLKMKGIIHVAAVGRQGQSYLATISECLDNALQLAKEQHCTSLGIAAIGSGPATAALQDWFRVFTDVTLSHLGLPAGPRSQPLDIVLVLFEPSDFDATVGFLRRAVWDSWTRLGSQRVGSPDDISFESKWREIAGMTRKPAFDAEEDAVDFLYRWNRLEQDATDPALTVIDIDLLGESGRRTEAFADRREALNRAEDLLGQTKPATLAGQKLRAAHTLLLALGGEEVPFADYVEGTLGAGPLLFGEEIIEKQYQRVTDLLSDAGYPHTEEGVSRMQSDTVVHADGIREEFSAAVSNVLPPLYEAIGLGRAAPYEMKFVAHDEYWSNWLDTDPATGRMRLQVNTHERIAWWQGKAEMLALHEIGGHVCQASMWRKRIEHDELTRVAGLSTVFGPEAVCMEGLAQTLSWLLPQNPLSPAAQRAQEMSHLGVLVWNNVHLMLQDGAPIDKALDYARQWAPGYRSEKAASKQAEDIREDHVLRTYLYAYGLSAHFYRSLAETLDEEARAAFLREAYSRPLSFEDVSSRLRGAAPVAN